MKRDAQADLYRVIGCLIVVAIHCWQSRYGVDSSASSIAISCGLADGVAIFWLLSGFFMYKNYSYRKTMKRTIKTVVIPTICVSLVAFFFMNNYLYNGVIGVEWHEKDEIIVALKTLLSWSNPVLGMGHLWYVYVYILLMICSPITYAFIKYLNEDSRGEKCFLIVSLVFLVWNDISDNQLLELGHHGVNGLLPAFVETVWGSLVYKYRKKFSKQKYGIYAVLGFVVLNVIRMVIQIYRNSLYEGFAWILYWFSSIGLLCAVSMAIFCFSGIINCEKKTFYRVTTKMAACSFMIYLIHPLIIAFLDRKKIIDMIFHVCSILKVACLKKICFVVIITLLVTVLSIVVTEIIRFMAQTARYMLTQEKRGK